MIVGMPWTRTYTLLLKTYTGPPRQNLYALANNGISRIENANAQNLKLGFRLYW